MHTLPASAGLDPVRDLDVQPMRNYLHGEVPAAMPIFTQQLAASTQLPASLSAATPAPLEHPAYFSLPIRYQEFHAPRRTELSIAEPFRRPRCAALAGNLPGQPRQQKSWR
jgi:hypothetical protein